MSVLDQCVHFITSRLRIFLQVMRPRAAVDIFGLLSAPALETPPPHQLRQRRHLYAHARKRAPQPTSKAFQARRGQPDLQPSRTAGVRAAAARGSNIGRRCCGRCSAHGSAHCGSWHNLAPTRRRPRPDVCVLMAQRSSRRWALLGTLPSGRVLAVTSCQVLRPPQPSNNGRNHFLRPCFSSAGLATLVQKARCASLRGDARKTACLRVG